VTDDIDNMQVLSTDNSHSSTTGKLHCTLLVISNHSMHWLNNTVLLKHLKLSSHKQHQRDF